MIWQAASHQWPATAQAIQTQSETVLSEIAAVMQSSANRIAGLTNQVNLEHHPLSQEADAALISVRTSIENLLCQGQILSVHPYQFQVGHKVESGYHLSPDRAVEILANKLLDVSDKHKPTGKLYAVGWMVAESSLANFATSTKALFKVVNIPELGIVSRRLAKEQSLQADKFAQLSVMTQPRFKPKASLNQEPLRTVLKWQGAQLAHIESLAADRKSPADKLTLLAKKRALQLQEWQSSINGLKQSNVELLKFEAIGTSEVLAAFLKQSQPPNRAHSYTFASLILSHEPLTFLSELFA